MTAKFTSLYSGSDKNASVLQYKKTGILIDCGGSFKGLCKQLCGIGLTINDIDCVMLTHTHRDHIGALSGILKNTDIPIYASYGSHSDLFDSGCDMTTAKRVVLDANTRYSVNDIDIEAFPIPHDTTAPFGYNFFVKGRTMSYLTDVGHISKDFDKAVKGREFVFLESNHDIEMLKKTGRPYPTIRRILSDTGHLCNEVSAEFALKLAEQGLKRLMLGHLSKDANTPTLAYRVMEEKLKSAGISVGTDVEINIAQRGMLSKTMVF